MMFNIGIVFKGVGYSLMGFTALSFGFFCAACYNYIINKDIKKARGYLFYALSGVMGVLVSPPLILSLPYVLVFDSYDRKCMDKIQKTWARSVTKWFFKTNVEGLENILNLNGKPGVYISNHQSYLDAYTLLWIDHVAFKVLLKRELMLLPVVGWMLKFLGHIPLSRSSKKSGKNALIECNKLLENNNSVFVFPEGTRSKTGKLGDFKMGAFKISYENNVPIIPIIIKISHEMMPRGNEISLGWDDITMTIHKPIYPIISESMGEFKNRVRDYYMIEMGEKVIKDE